MVIEKTKYVPLSIPEVDLPAPEAPKALEGKLIVLTPELLQSLYMQSVDSGEPIVVWAADEQYIRELEDWFRGNLVYIKQLQRQQQYLKDVIEELRRQSGSEVAKQN